MFSRENFPGRLVNTTTNASQTSVFRIKKATTGVKVFLCNLFALKTLIAQLASTVVVIRYSAFQLRNLMDLVQETRNAPTPWHVQVENANFMVHSKTIRFLITASLAKVGSLTKAPLNPQFAFLPLK